MYMKVRRVEANEENGKRSSIADTSKKVKMRSRTAPSTDRLETRSTPVRQILPMRGGSQPSQQFRCVRTLTIHSSAPCKLLWCRLIPFCGFACFLHVLLRSGKRIDRASVFLAQHPSSSDYCLPDREGPASHHQTLRCTQKNHPMTHLWPHRRVFSLRYRLQPIDRQFLCCWV